MRFSSLFEIVRSSIRKTLLFYERVSIVGHKLGEKLVISCDKFEKFIQLGSEYNPNGNNFDHDCSFLSQVSIFKRIRNYGMIANTHRKMFYRLESEFCNKTKYTSYLENG